MAGWVGALVAVIAIGLVVLNWRVAVIAIVSVTVSLTAAGFVLIQLGAALNVMVVTGLVIATSAVDRGCVDWRVCPHEIAPATFGLEAIGPDGSRLRRTFLQELARNSRSIFGATH